MRYCHRQGLLLPPPPAVARRTAPGPQVKGRTGRAGGGVTVRKPEHVARLQKTVDEHFERLYQGAQDYAEKVQSDDVLGDAPWLERTRRDAFNMKLLELQGAERRAKQQAATGPSVFGVVFVPQLIDDPKAWEAQARGHVIDTTAGPAVISPVPEPEPVKK